ncbi:MAG: hypothetical protein QXE06_05875 [Candidatus Bathyarchaeia archaeon]
MMLQNNHFSPGEKLCICKLKHDIRVESKIDLAREEIKVSIGVEPETVYSLPLLIKKEPIVTKLHDKVLHRMMRLLYLGKAQGFIFKEFDITNLKKLAKRATYLREFYVILKIPKYDIINLVKELDYKCNPIELQKTEQFIDISPNLQVFNQQLNAEYYLATLIFIPCQTILEYCSEILKLPYVTFTKQFTNLSERIKVMEKGVEKGIDELFDHLNHEFDRMPWLGLFKEHIGDYVDWAFSDFRTWGLHFIHKHEGKADPWLARSALNLLGVEEGCKVLDPFCGSGSFIADAPLMNINAYGVDINPLSTLIARVKCSLTELPLIELKETMLKIHDKALANDLFVGKIKFQQLIKDLGVREIHELSHKQKLFEKILSIKESIDAYAHNELVKDFLYTILSRSIIDVSEKKKINIWYNFISDFINFYLLAYATQQALRKLNVESKGCCKIITGDSHSIQELLGYEKVDGIVCSPPYFDALDYVSFSMLPILILGLHDEAKELYISTIGSKARTANLDKDCILTLPESSRHLINELLNHKRQKKAQVVLKYLLDMRDCLTEFSKIVKQGSRVIFVVGRYHHWKFGASEMQVDGAQVLIDLGESAGLVLEDELSHNISKIEAGKRIKEESVIIWKKDNIPSKRNLERSKNVIKFYQEKSRIKGLDAWLGT